MQKVILVGGVPGSGKTWVCRQLTHKYAYLPHDEHYKDHAEQIEKLAESSTKPILTEVPFAERVLKERLESKGIEVIPVFVIVHPDVAKFQYETREKKPFPKNNYTRAGTIINRATEWGAFHGTSQEVLNHLESLPT